MTFVTLGDHLLPKQRQSLKAQAQQRSRHYPDFIQAYLKFTQSQESTQKIQKWVALSVLAAALERKVWLDAGHFTVYPNLYVFVIGESGVIRKSTSTGIGVSLLKSLTNINLMSERVTDASLIQQLERAGKEFHVAEKLYRQSSVFCYASELVVFMREVSGAISELLTTFWDCPKDWTYETKMGGAIKIDAPCLNVLGASTPSWLSRAIPVDELEGGLASRVIFVVERNAPERIVAWPQLDPEIASMRPKLIEDLEQIHQLTGPFGVTEKAYRFYEAWYRSYKTEKPKNDDPRFRGYRGRKPVTVWKLAMLFAASEGSQLVFDQGHLENALVSLKEVEDTMFDAFGASGNNKLAEGLQHIRELLGLKKSITHKELLRLFFRNYSGSEIEQIMNDLTKMENIQVHVNGRDITYTWRG